MNPLAILLAAAALPALTPGQRAATTPARDVTGTVTINGAAVTLTNVYAFGTRTPTGQDDGTLLFFTSAPLSDDVLQSLVTAPNIINRAKLAALAMNGPLTVVDVYVRPLAISEARSGTPAQTGMASTFYSKAFASVAGYTSHAGSERLVLAKSEAGTIAGTVRMALQKLPSGGGATVTYDVTFKTKLRTPGK